MSDFVKDSDRAFADQLTNLSDKLSTYQAALGLTAGQLTAAADDAAMMDFMTHSISTSKSYGQGWTALKDDARKGKGSDPIATFPSPVNVTTPPTAVLPGIEERFRSLAAQIKANPAYTNAMGEDLGIVADQDTTVLTAPQLKVEMKGGSPVISFKKSISDGIRLYSQRGTEKSFSFLAVDTRSPYVDTRPNETPDTPETRQYYAYYIKADEQVGSQSDKVSVSV